MSCRAVVDCGLCSASPLADTNMSDEKIYPVAAEAARHAHIDEQKYLVLYEQSVKDPDGFWAERATEFITWSKPWTKVSDWSYDPKNLHIRWFDGGKLNVS